MADKNKRGKVRFIRVRGRVIPIREKLSRTTDSVATAIGGASIASGGVGALLSSRRMGKTRAKLSRASVGLSKIPKAVVQKTLLSPFKLKKFAVKSALISTALSTLSFGLAPDRPFNELGD